MTGSRALSRSNATSVLVLGGLIPVACGEVADDIRATEAAEKLGFGVEVPCDINLYQQRRMTGAFLQRPVGTAGGVPLYVSGKAVARGDAGPLPRNLVIEGKTIRGLTPAEEGSAARLEGTRRAVARPIPGLGSGDRLPQAYWLGYRLEGVDYDGPLVVGMSPTATEIPMAGEAVMTGPLHVTFAPTGGAVTTARGRFSLVIGHGTGRAAFTAGDFVVDSGPPLPFARMSWTRLGVCAPRVVSSGQGRVGFTDAAGMRVPILPTAAEPAARLSFESSQFAGAARPGPPGAVGGIFAVQGNAANLEGVFVSQP